MLPALCLENISSSTPFTSHVTATATCSSLHDRRGYEKIAPPGFSDQGRVFRQCRATTIILVAVLFYPMAELPRLWRILAMSINVPLALCNLFHDRHGCSLIPRVRISPLMHSELQLHFFSSRWIYSECECMKPTWWGEEGRAWSQERARSQRPQLTQQWSVAVRRGSGEVRGVCPKGGYPASGNKVSHSTSWTPPHPNPLPLNPLHSSIHPLTGRACCCAGPWESGVEKFKSCSTSPKKKEELWTNLSF